MCASVPLLPVPQVRYRMPAEWEPHRATWLSWPHNEETWPGILARAEDAYARMVVALARSEPVHINVCDATMEAHAREVLADAGATGHISFHHIPTNDAWCRDHGALFVQRTTQTTQTTDDTPSHSLVALDWEYNAWGGKYPPYDLDNQVAARMAAALGVERVEGGMVLEGGSVDTNGRGLLLTTESCLLHPNRNPDLSRDEIEQRLCTLLGAERVLWLGDGIVGDDTDGHIDDITRFVAPDTVVTAVEPDPTDANYAPLQENLARLRSLREQHGLPLRIVALPMPPAVVFRGERVPASYANFFIANRAVLVPCYHPPTDRHALEILQDLFPTRAVLGIDCTNLIPGLGAIHCLTQQVPM